MHFQLVSLFMQTHRHTYTRQTHAYSYVSPLLHYDLRCHNGALSKVPQHFIHYVLGSSLHSFLLLTPPTSCCVLINKVKYLLYDLAAIFLPPVSLLKLLILSFYQLNFSFISAGTLHCSASHRDGHERVNRAQTPCAY